MDPLSITTAVTTLIPLFIQTAQQIKTLIERYQKASSGLLEFLGQTERMRLLLEQLRGLTRELGVKDNSLVIAFSDAECRKTIKELHDLVCDIAGSGGGTTVVVRLVYLMKHGRLVGLKDRLDGCRREIEGIMISVAMHSSLRTEGEMKKLIAGLEAQSQPKPAFEERKPQELASNPKKVKEPVSEEKAISKYGEIPSEQEILSLPPPSYTPVKQDNTPYPMSTVVPTWPGQQSRASFGAGYLTKRDALSDAAYYGHWDHVFEILKFAASEYGENWVNFPRLGKDPARSSGWTVLHQATFWCAPSEVVGRLCALGGLLALPTLSTSPGELPHKRMTPIEIARYLGFRQLYSLLTPQVHHVLPIQTLLSLERMLHKFITGNLVPRAESKHLRLPDVQSLQCLRSPQLWFPINNSRNENRLGYMIRLDDRELLVQKRSPSDTSMYRISEDSIHQVEEAVVFNA